MNRALIVADCPECRVVGTVFLGTCEVCFAEVFEREDDVSHGGEAPFSPPCPNPDSVGWNARRG
jgi:hypothetical protein